MRTGILICLLVSIMMATVFDETDAWFGSRSRSSSKSSGSSRRSSGGWFGRVRSKIKKATKTAANKVRNAARSAVDKVKGAAKFAAGAGKGAVEMAKAYKEMRDANWAAPGTDKYFHAKGNYNAAKHGPGGKWAAKVISDARESFQNTFQGQSKKDAAADQKANEWGRNGGDPNKYRPNNLPKQYRK